MILVHEYTPHQPKRFVVEITEREVQVLHAGMLFLEDHLTPNEDKAGKVLAINDLWQSLDDIREQNGIRILPV